LCPPPGSSMPFPDQCDDYPTNSLAMFRIEVRSAFRSLVEQTGPLVTDLPAYVGYNDPACTLCSALSSPPYTLTSPICYDCPGPGAGTFIGRSCPFGFSYTPGYFPAPIGGPTAWDSIPDYTVFAGKYPPGPLGLFFAFPSPGQRFIF